VGVWIVFGNVQVDRLEYSLRSTRGGDHEKTSKNPARLIVEANSLVLAI